MRYNAFMKSAALDFYMDPYDRAVAEKLLDRQHPMVRRNTERLLSDSKTDWEQKNDEKSFFDLSKVNTDTFKTHGYYLGDIAATATGAGAAWVLAKLIAGDRLTRGKGVLAAVGGGVVGHGAYSAASDSRDLEPYMDQRTDAFAKQFRKMIGIKE